MQQRVFHGLADGNSGSCPGMLHFDVKSSKREPRQDEPRIAPSSRRAQHCTFLNLCCQVGHLFFGARKEGEAVFPQRL